VPVPLFATSLEAYQGRIVLQAFAGWSLRVAAPVVETPC
jgi:hypothetical protein